MMSRKRYIIAEGVSPGQRRARLTGAEYHHLTDVMRATKGDQVALLDGDGGVYEAVIEKITGNEALLEIISHERVEKRSAADMALAVIKAHRFDIAVEKCSELGAGRIIPFSSTRSVWRGDEDRAERKRLRMERKVASACKQSGRPYFPVVMPVVDFDSLVEIASSYSRIYVADDAGCPPSKCPSASACGSVLGIVGPEGGFTKTELDRLIGLGAVPMSLSPCTLRAETAVICLLYQLSIMMGEAGRDGGKTPR